MIANYTVYMTELVFIAVCLVLLTLPFIPAWREWRKPTDVGALPISANYTSDIDHFARRLHADANARMGLGPGTGYENFDEVVSPPGTMNWAGATQRLISRRSIESDDAIVTSQPLYVQGNFRAGDRSALSAVYTIGNLTLGPGSEVRDWAHADGLLQMDTGCKALRRVSAGVAMELGKEVWFERLNAPAIYFGGRAAHADQDDETVAAQEANLAARSFPKSYASLPNAVQQTPDLFLIRGDCVLPAGVIFQGSLVVTGFLSIGAGTVVVGDLKARSGVSLARGARVEGAITCEKRIYVFRQGQVFGPVISETDVLIGQGAVIGLPEAATTISADTIIVECGVVTHGMIWARDVGMVKLA